ncbi:MAG: hypothetical protein WCP21_22830 [Armatimonadota bacterium]
MFTDEFGGGLAYYGGRLYVTTGFAAVFALEPVIDWLVVAVLFLIAGLALGPKPQRIGDYFANAAVGRLPFVLVGLLWIDPLLGRFLPGLLKLAQTAGSAPPNLAAVPGLTWLAVGGMITMLLMAWGLFLNFFALREASGMKMPHAVWVYALAVIMGEVVSKVAIGLLS